VIVFVTRIVTAFGQRIALLAALCLILISALRIAKRQGRHAAEAEFAIRAAEARIRALQASQETRHDVQTADRVDLERRVDRWMRD
jgi:hypothetical protein